MPTAVAEEYLDARSAQGLDTALHGRVRMLGFGKCLTCGELSNYAAEADEAQVWCLKHAPPFTPRP